MYILEIVTLILVQICDTLEKIEIYSIILNYIKLYIYMYNVYNYKVMYIIMVLVNYYILHSYILHGMYYDIFI